MSNRLTLEAYFEMEETAEYKSEFYQGEVFAMSGATINNELIRTNFVSEVSRALMDRDCTTFGSDLKIRIEAADANVYPDGMVICGDPNPYRDRNDIITNPQVVIEVLSDSTAAWDRGGKFRKYERLPSLREYILVEQDAPQVDLYRREGQGKWILDRYEGLETAVHIPSLNISIPVKGIYHMVDFLSESQGPA